MAHNANQSSELPLAAASCCFHYCALCCVQLHPCDTACITGMTKHAIQFCLWVVVMIINYRFTSQC